jgi:protein-disulfide isomerase
MRQSWLLLAFMALVGGLVLAAFTLRSLPAPERGPADAGRDLSPLSAPTVDYANPSKGATEAAVRIVEFGDLLCGPCGEMSPLLDRILGEYAGSVRLVWKDFPDVQSHAGADIAAIAARCAQRQGAFWEFHHALLERNASASEANLQTVAGSLGLNASEFAACLTSRDTAALVDRDFIEGQRLRVDGTPYFFVNDRRISGSVGYDQLTQIIEAEGGVRATAAPAP